MAHVKPVPDGYHTVTPHVIVDQCAKAIEFYGKAFGAQSRLTLAGPDGKVMHAEIQIGDSIIMLNDEMPSMGMPGIYKSPTSAGVATAAIFLYVEDVDQAFNRAVAAGCTVRMPLADMFWGDRYGQVIDPFGLTWALATHKEDVSEEEMGRRQKQFMAQAG